MTALEELADLKDVTGKKAPRTRSGQTRKPTGKTKNDDAKNKQKTKAPDQKKQEPAKTQQQKKQEPVKDQAGDPAMSEAQKRAVFNLSRRRGNLC